MAGKGYHYATPRDAGTDLNVDTPTTSPRAVAVATADVACKQSAPPPVIDLSGVSRVYPGPPEVAALRRVDLTIGRTEYVAVVGPSGSGKSTLLNVIGLLDRATAGTYRLDGLDVSGLRERDRAAAPRGTATQQYRAAVLRRPGSVGTGADAGPG